MVLLEHIKQIYDALEVPLENRFVVTRPDELPLPDFGFKVITNEGFLPNELYVGYDKSKLSSYTETMKKQKGLPYWCSDCLQEHKHFDECRVIGYQAILKP